MGKQNRLLRMREAVLARHKNAPVMVSRVTYGQNRLRQKLEAVRARHYVAPFLNPPRVTVGRHTYGEPLIPAFGGTAVTVEIGSFCSIAANVMLLLGAGHNTAWVSTWPIREVFGLPGQYEQHPVCRGTIVIGNDVWIGRDVLILDGVTIGHGAVIGARAVVTKDVRPYAVVAGVPPRDPPPIYRRAGRRSTRNRMVGLARGADHPRGRCLERCRYQRFSRPPRCFLGARVGKDGISRPRATDHRHI